MTVRCTQQKTNEDHEHEDREHEDHEHETSICFGELGRIGSGWTKVHEEQKRMKEKICMTGLTVQGHSIP